MILLASADLHGDHNIYKWLVGVTANICPDAVILAGDLLGAPSGYTTIEESQRADAIDILKILERIEQPVLYIMGNDDMIELESNSDAIRSVHGCSIELGKLNVVGYQYSLPFMGGIYEKSEDGISEDLIKLDSLINDNTVLVTHCPAFGVLDIGVMGMSAGSESIKGLVDRKKPQVHIHGHIHGEFGVRGRHFNVAAAGHKRAMLIDIDKLEHEVLSDVAV